MTRQILTLQLDEITAGDYLQWIRDPDPPALDTGLRSIHVDADPVGDTVTAILDWAGPAPPAQAAAPAAGLPLADGIRIGRSEDGDIARITPGYEKRVGLSSVVSAGPVAAAC